MARRGGIDVDIRFDRIRELNDQIPRVVASLVRRATLDTEAHAKQGVPVRTGALKNSISSSISVRGNSVVGEVATNLHYAAYVEYGTRNSPAQPYLIPAFDRVRAGLVGQLGSLERYLR